MSAIDAVIWDQPTFYGTRNLAVGAACSLHRNDACAREVELTNSARDQRVTTDALTSTNHSPSGYIIRRSEANDHHHPTQAGA